MKKLPLGFALGMLAQVAFANSASLRCEVDNLNPEEALGRNRYIKACFPEVIWENATRLNGMRRPNSIEDAWSLVQTVFELAGTKPRNKPLYYTPVFLNNPAVDAQIGWAAPKVAPSSEDLTSAESTKAYCARPENVPPVNLNNGPVGFRSKFTCTSSCYAPEVRVYFSSGYLPMKTAFETRPKQITVVSESSTLDNLSYRNEDISRWTVSIRSEPHVLRVLTMSSGKTMRITDNHPLVLSDGFVREAKDIKTGDSLVRSDGTPEQIIKVVNQDYFGKVYNVQPKGESAKGNIVIAEGYLSASNYYQNDGYELINERIFRSELPEEILR
jgi:hypothetical protein